MGISVSAEGISMPIWSAYEHPEGLFDEIVDLANSPRLVSADITKALLSMPPHKLGDLCNRADSMFRRMGVTFNVYGDRHGVEKILPFDPIPRVIDAETWARLEAGLIQRVCALNEFLADIYGDGCILKDGLVPRDLIVGCPQFRYGAMGIRPPLGNFVTVAGIDLIRRPDGRFFVLEDNLRTPSGV